MNYLCGISRPLIAIGPLLGYDLDTLKSLSQLELIVANALSY